MSDDVMRYADLPLRGEKVSIGSPSTTSASQSLQAAATASRKLLRAATPVITQATPALWPALSCAGALALWIPPALLLPRYQPDQVLDALARVALKPTGVGLLMLSLALAYVVLTGLASAWVTGIPRRRGVRVLLRLAAVPLVTASLVATLVVAMPLFFGALHFCIPSLI